VGRPAVFLDRDGTIVVDKEYLATTEGIELLPRAAEGLAALAGMGYVLVLVTNQSGVGRGYFPAAMVQAQYLRLQELLAPHRVHLAGMEFCPHGPDDGCACRKPRPGMLLTAARTLGLDCAASFMIGDKEADVEAGRAAGCRTLRMAPPGTPSRADAVVADLVAAAAWIRQATAQ
jgi:D-glycero-D-manno-heptose 1,7-bisphosphate phosphatase